MDDIPPQRQAINSWSPEYIEELYRSWKKDRDSVPSQWQTFFDGFELGLTRDGSASTPAATPAKPDNDYIELQGRVNSLVYHYRDIGHLMATVDPLGRERPRPENLRLSAFRLEGVDPSMEFRVWIEGLPGMAKLKDIVAHLEKVYCGNVGAEFMHIQNTEERRWIQSRIERLEADDPLGPGERTALLRKLHQAELFESFVHTRFKGQKRFSLEGAETLIPLLWIGIDRSGTLGIEEVVMGMAHRGRLNVLANIINKAYDDIFAEFEDNYEKGVHGGGDVKYHKGYSSNFMTTGGKLVYITLAANPSHLEAVDPVVLGRARAKQRLRGDTAKRNRVMPLLIHGDAAFAGQGIVAETLQMVKLPGYATGGTLHIIVNNQIGFTTDPINARSSVYSTDVAKMVESPVFHVNAEDVDACARVIRLAVEYRQRYGKDVVIDMWCYRKYGHNEADEPAFTQPLMYDLIRAKEPVRTIYSRQLVGESIISTEDVAQMEQDLREVLDAAHAHGRLNPVRKNQAAFRKKWDGFKRNYNFDPVDTTVSADVLRQIATRCAAIPEGFHPHRKVEDLYQQRLAAVTKGEPFDWGTAEMLAYGSLLWEGTPIRLTGQDSRRGTFSHRHAVLTDIENEKTWTPLSGVKEGQAEFCVHDSPLAEASVLGYEYGYSLGDPEMLIMWEAQFGDFVNGAQTIIDQFIASAESKWERFSGLVMLLPHGYEGQGAEHSSAKLERFLQLCADDNMQVVNLTTGAQYFHLMRRQIKRRFRKPLVVMSPKSTLREKNSTINDLATGTFREIIDDPSVSDRSRIKRIMLCSGKVYNDLVARREETGSDETAIVRMEQLYPVHTEMLTQILESYPAGAKLVWAQEEPRNMGAWTFISLYLEEHFGLKLEYVGRPASPVPAVGSPKMHLKEVQDLREAAFPSRVEAVAAV